MKKIAIIILSIVAFIAILIGTVFYLTSGMTDKATAFFTDVKSKNYSKAYSYLSEDFKAITPKEEFIKFLDKSALLKFKEASWSSRSISGGKGELDGSVTTETGGVVPIKIGFIKEHETWKIYSIYIPQAGLAQKDSSEKLPSDSELVKLVDESLIKFANSVNDKSFDEFHGYISNLWAKQFSVDKFNEIFKQFIDADMDLLPALKSYAPVFDVVPSINDDGVLILEGHYPTKPVKLTFKLSYIYEGLNWKLIGTRVKTI